MKPRIAKQMPQHTPRKREGMDKAHLGLVGLCSCVACGWHFFVDPHHLLRAEGRGLSRKTADKWAIPLCRKCHDALHAAGDEERWLAKRGVDGRAVASALWAARGDLEAMRRVIFRARQATALTVKANA